MHTRKKKKSPEQTNSKTMHVYRVVNLSYKNTRNKKERVKKILTGAMKSNFGAEKGGMKRKS